MSTKPALADRPSAPAATRSREARPFVWIQPKAALTSEGFRGLQSLRVVTEAARPRLAHSLVEFTYRTPEQLDLTLTRTPAISVRNRRRRAAILWINAILEAKCDRSTLEQLTRNWLPQLAGTGPDPRRAIPAGRRFVEFIRGLVTPYLFDGPAENLIGPARSWLALENVLGIHLRAIERIARKPTRES